MKHALLLAGLIAVTVVTDAFGQSTSFSIQTYPLLGNTHVAADFNGDGKLDLAGPGVTGAAVMLNNGNGTFSPKTEFPLINYPQGIAAGDFNSERQDRPRRGVAKRAIQHGSPAWHRHRWLRPRDVLP